MKLSSRLLIREVGKYVHILNPITGKLVTLTSKLFDLVPSAEEKDIDGEVLDVITITDEKATSNSRNYRKTLIDLGLEYKFPTIVNIELTRRCLLDCKHCYITSEDHKSHKINLVEGLSDKKVFQLVEELKKMGVFLIVLTGGEPCIAQNIQFFVEACKKYNMSFELFSALQVIPDWLEHSKLELARIQVSIYSINPKIHDDITRKDGSLAISLENIRRCKEKGIYVEVATPLMSLNFDDRNSIEEYFIQRGIRQNFSWPIVSEYYSEHTNKYDLNVSSEQFLTFIGERPDFLIQCTWDNPESSLCEAGVSIFAILADGSVWPCSQYPISVGNILSQNIEEIYFGNDMQKAIKYKVSDLCDSCGLCNFCMGTNYSETGDPLIQPDFMVQTIEYVNLRRKGVK